MSVSPGSRGPPPSSSATMAPTAHMSTPAPYLRAPYSSSGARYHRVATSCDMSPPSAAARRARPKSATFTTPPQVSSTLEGFRSRCSTPRACMCATPATSCTARPFTAASGMRPAPERSRAPRSVSQSSRAMATADPIANLASTWTTFGWPAHRSRHLASRSTTSGRPSDGRRSVTRLSATARPVESCVARRTSPKAPPPRRPRTA
mmetsp:Transcript_10967/g.38048  ORF Transcript_10967/g.38048 Transcript_10967/m.38048 type:complete len:206 (-) Transcript_10967:287-904(-)